MILVYLEERERENGLNLTVWSLSGLELLGVLGVYMQRMHGGPVVYYIM